MKRTLQTFLTYISKKERIWRVLSINWIILGIIAVLLLLLCLWICYRYQCCRKAKRLVHTRSDYEKLTELNQALAPFGFVYDQQKNIFYSRKDAWQRKFGYGKIYDEMAPVMNMIIDCEPIYFEYDNRRWMIECWKGQYGITTGAEIGIYVEGERDDQKDPEDVFYECVSEEEELPMEMTLYKNGRKVFQRQENHWWLTGFELGEFSWPGELMMKTAITFRNHEMLEAFLKGCYQAGYQPEELHVWAQRVAFSFYQPKNPQNFRYGRLFRRLIQWQNRHNCKIYHRVTRDFTRTLDKLDYLMLAYPRIFAMITNVGRIAWEKKGS